MRDDHILNVVTVKKFSKTSERHGETSSLASAIRHGCAMLGENSASNTFRHIVLRFDSRFERIANQIVRLRNAGVNQVLLNPVFDEEAQMEELCQNVLTRV